MFRTVWKITLELVKGPAGLIAALAAGAAGFLAVGAAGFAVYALAWPPFQAPGDGATLVYLATPYASAMGALASAWGGRAALSVLGWAMR